MLSAEDELVGRGLSGFPEVVVEIDDAVDRLVHSLYNLRGEGQPLIFENIGGVFI